jgi:hypothetical protein
LNVIAELITHCSSRLFFAATSLPRPCAVFYLSLQALEEAIKAAAAIQGFGRAMKSSRSFFYVGGCAVADA